MLTQKEYNPIVSTGYERITLAKIETALSNQDDQSAKFISINGQTIELPNSLVEALKQIVSYLGEGNAISITTVNAELGTQLAADLLNVPKSYLIGLLETGEIPFHMVGTHHKICLDDLMAYKKKSDAVRRQALRELTQWSEELGLYDDQAL